MNKSAVFSHFSHILDNMIENSLFFDTYFMDPVGIEDIEGSELDEAIPANICINFGATRGCIVDENYDYVVKFDVAQDGLECSACEREVDIYTRAKQHNLHQYFAEVEFLGYYTKTIMFYDLYILTKYIEPLYYYDPEEFDANFAEHEDEYGELHPITISIPLYAYRKASSHWCGLGRTHDSEKAEEAAKKINSPMRERNLAVAVDFVREYGEDAYQSLTDFMYKENINDLHSGNVGNIDGSLVFIDFSGYHDHYNSYDNSSSQSVFD